MQAIHSVSEGDFQTKIYLEHPNFYFKFISYSSNRCIPDAEAVSVFEGIDKFMLWYCEFSFKNVIISCKISLFPVIINTFITSLISSTYLGISLDIHII